MSFSTSSSSSSSISICLSCVGQARKILHVEKSAFLQELHVLACTQFDTQNISLKHGFPPKLLEKSTTTTLQQAGIQDKDRIIVVVMEETKEKKKETSTTKPRPKRAAARAATESFEKVIRAQDELMRESNTTKKKKTTSSSGNTKRKRTTPSNNKNKFARLPAGQRLQDGALVGSPSNNKRRNNNNKTTPFKSQDDVSVALLNALNSNSGGGKVGQVLRGAMRSAMENRHQATRAILKVSAVQSQLYTIQKTTDERLAVKYSKGVEGRGMFDEQVDFISRNALEAVIRAIYQSDEQQREMLSPPTLAQVSPRVFWSLVYIFCCNENDDDESNTNNNNNTTTTITSVEDCLAALLPDLDWSFLKKRKRVLSSKAQENLRQQQNQEKQENVEAAQEAVQAVENAMDQLEEYDAGQRRQRAARAAMARYDGGGETATNQQQETTTNQEWQLVTPTERDDEELQECIATTTDKQEDVQLIIAALHTLDIFNWRQLANANTSTISKATNIPELQVEAWMDHAQAQSVDEMIVQVCDSRVDVVEALRDEARTGTIKDLANWKHMPDLLYSSTPSLAGMSDGVDVSNVKTWCERAQRVLDDYEWVQWYATPVE